MLFSDIEINVLIKIFSIQIELIAITKFGNHPYREEGLDKLKKF